MITTKQRAFLRKMVHDMEPIFQVGKSGVTPEMIKAIDDALEARELIKIAVLKNCEEDVRDICEKVTSRTHSDPVYVIGHKFSIYRPSKKPQIELPR